MGRLCVHLSHFRCTPDTHNIYIINYYISVGDAHEFGEPEKWDCSEYKRGGHIHTNIGRDNNTENAQEWYIEIKNN